jgi:NAD(P)-dependent dehydrogenase (short-subunit alcohol dehydrogenase family)
MLNTLQFGASTSVDEIVRDLDLSTKRYVVTGASSGLGKECARALASRGAEVIFAVRSVDRGEAAAGDIRALIPDAKLAVRSVDLTSLASVRAFCDTLVQEYDGLDGILANAGIMATDYGRTVDGFEMQLGTNHLGHFVLVNRLAPLLLARKGARVVLVSSGAHRLADVDMIDPNFVKRPYDRWDSYGQSKSANALFALGFDRRYAAHGVHAYAVAPGVILDTNLHHHLDPELFVPLRKRQPTVSDLPRKTAKQGAATLVWGLVHPETEALGGAFLEDCGVSEVNPDTRLPNGVIPWVRDEKHAEDVWALSEQMVAETFPRPAAQDTATPGGPSSGSVASGLSVNRQASTDQLVGQNLRFETEAGKTVGLQFTKDGVDWDALPGITYASAGRCATDVVEVAPDVLLITVMLPAETLETMQVIFDQSTRRAFFVASRFSDLQAPFERKTRLTQTFTNAVVQSDTASGAPIEPTRDLLGLRALYHYSENTVYEHIYLNSKWYSYQCLKGMRAGDCGTDEASYFKVRDGVYVVTWREILIDLAAVFVYDMDAKRATGMAWGAPGDLVQPKYIPTGSWFEKMNEPGYPDGIDIL